MKRAEAEDSLRFEIKPGDPIGGEPREEIALAKERFTKNLWSHRRSAQATSPSSDLAGSNS